MDISRPLDKIMGSYLTAIFAAAVGFIGPVLLTVLVVHFVKKYVMMSKKPLVWSIQKKAAQFWAAFHY
jgi:hypothetical protein